MKYITICLFVFLGMIACENKTGNLNPEVETGELSIQMDVQRIPSEVERIEGILTRPDFESIHFDFEVTEQSASQMIEYIAVGLWKVKIDAFNDVGEIIYTATTEVLVVANQVTPVHIHLLKTGSVEIIVTWGDNDPMILVDIPDAAFLNALIEEGVDTNGDGLISYSEAESVTSLYVGFRRINDMTGIEAFVNLDSLNCTDNFFHSLNVSAISGLSYLICGQSNLSGLDVSNNHALTHLDCSDQEILELDVTNNPLLTNLNCHNNRIGNLDLTNCPYIEILWVQENQLTTLDISTNYKIRELYLNNMPTLNKVCVWTTPFPPAGVFVDKTDSPNFAFTTECSN